jgi:uncharacterized UBP type Zn finger protein
MSYLNIANQSEWLNQVNNVNSIENNIDYFFTQRKVTEYIEIIDEKTLERKKKKIKTVSNFLAINMPTHIFKNYTSLIIDIEIWGDNMFNFKGSIIKYDGEVPQFMIKLKEDKNIFLKLMFKDNDKLQKTFITFIPITKRYQHVNENSETGDDE